LLRVFSPGQKIETPSIWSVASSKLTDVNQTIRVSTGRATGKSDRGRFLLADVHFRPDVQFKPDLISATSSLTLKKHQRRSLHLAVLHALNVP
jgi:hypothetical protein